MNNCFPDPIYFCGMYHLSNTGDTWEQYINDCGTNAEYPAHDMERYSPVYLPNIALIKDKRVLDLGVNLGYTCIFASHFGAKSVTGLEVRQSWIDTGQKVLDCYPVKNIKLVQGDVNNFELLTNLCRDAQVVIALGLFYHLNNHYQFLKNICDSPTVETLILETAVPNLSEDMDICWHLESVSDPLNGYDSLSQVLVGAPNVKWIEVALDQLNWKIVNKSVTTDEYWRPARACVTAIRK
jgi:SAM-dependent methyltransferase